MRLRKCGNYLVSHILKSYNECRNKFKTIIIHVNCLIIRENTKICKAFYKVQSVKNSDRMRYVYFSVPDVRYTRNWHKQVLVRKAENRHDYIGGINNYTSLEDFGEAVNKLMSDRSYL